MEYCDGGDLFQKISQQRKKERLMDEKEIWNIFIQAVRALKELHERKIFHRDIKSANIFLTKNGVVKLGDLNVSKVAKKGLLYTQTGTPYYASPEVWKDKPYDFKSDIWSLGCILYEMCTLKPPFQADSMEGLYKSVIKGVYNRIPSCFSKDLSNVISMMLQLKPSQRIDCDNILTLPFIQKRFNPKYLLEIDNKDYKVELLKTIKLPQNILFLTDKLPKADYEPMKLRKTTIPKINNSLELSKYKNTSNVFLSLSMPKGIRKSGLINPSLYKKNRKLNLPSLSNKNILHKKPDAKENKNVNSDIRKIKNRELKRKVEMLLMKRPPKELNNDLMKINGLSLKKQYTSQQPKRKVPKNRRLAPIK